MKIIGYRGARGLAPENTISGLRKAIEHDVDGVEFDVRVTKDRVVILHHDPHVTSPDGQHLSISEHPYSQLKEHQPDLATLDEVFSSIGTSVLLFIEVKSNEPIQPIADRIQAYIESGGRRERIVLLSFSYSILKQLREQFPEVQLMVNEKWSGVRAHYRARKLGSKHIDMDHRWLWWGFISMTARSGWQLYTYGLNDPRKARAWKRYGLAGVITDFPDRFKA